MKEMLTYFLIIFVAYSIIAVSLAVFVGLTFVLPVMLFLSGYIAAWVIPLWIIVMLSLFTTGYLYLPEVA